MESINYYQKCVLRLLVNLASVVVVVGILTGIASDKEVTDRTRRDIMNYKQKEDEVFLVNKSQLYDFLGDFLVESR